MPRVNRQESNSESESIKLRLGERLKQARLDAGLTQAEAASAIGMATGSYLSGVEGGTSNMYVAELARLADLYEVSYDWLFGKSTVKHSFRNPKSIKDWEVMYADRPWLAHAHFAIDKGDEENRARAEKMLRSTARKSSAAVE